jgi:hypothetical protein
MRKKHGFTPKYIHVQAPTAAMNRHRHSRCHYKQNSGSAPAGMNNLHIGGPAGRQNPRWLADAHSGSSDNDLRSGRPNSSDDDLRADAAAIRPSPTSPLEGRGQAEGRRVGGQSAGGSDYLVGRETSSGCLGGRWHRKQRRSRSDRRARHTAAASATDGERPSPPITEGRSGPLPTRRRAPTRRTPLPSTDDEHP